MSSAAPFVVGAPRSGTTLLRLMLDAHPALAVPPETGFLPALLALPARDAASSDAFLRVVVGFDSWPDFHLCESALAARVRALDPFTLAGGVRAFYGLYAARFGKTRWGDKTPFYGFHQRALAALLPEARFVHLIRDGRDVALSVRPLWFSPGQDMRELARDWVMRIAAARAEAPPAGRSMEVRYEALVRDPRRVLQDLCGFLDLGFDDAMLRYDARATARLAEHEARVDADGRPRVSREQRRAQQWRTQTPPDPTRIGRYRTEMTRAERREFESVAGPLLADLGYEVGG